MNDSDKKEFAMIMVGIAELYDRQFSKALAKLYFAALKDYSIAQVYEAVNAWVVNPEAGQFMPKPADIVRYFEGTKKDNEAQNEIAGQMQWSQVMKAIQQCGSYRTPTFRDIRTFNAVQLIGGYKSLCGLTEKDLEFKARDFVKHYASMVDKPENMLPYHPDSQHSLKTIVTNVDKMRIDAPEQTVAE